jgi:hypothetical protein
VFSVNKNESKIHERVHIRHICSEPVRVKGGTISFRKRSSEAVRVKGGTGMPVTLENLC